MKTDDKKRILFVTTSYPRYEGDVAGNFFVPLIDRLREKFDITILAPDDKAVKENDNYVKRFNYFFFPGWQKLTYNEGIPENIQNNPLRLIQVPFLLLSLLSNILKYSKNSDLIITNWMLPSGLAGTIISYITKKPHLIIEHSAGIYTLLKLPFKKHLIHFISSNSNKIIFVSPHLQDLFKEYLSSDTNKISIIPMGIDINQYKPEINISEVRDKYSIPEDNQIILFMGRLVEIKGLEILFKALEGIDNVTLIVAGEGIKLDYYRELSEKSELNSIFTGNVKGKEKAELLKVSDVMVFPSVELASKRSEGAPVTLMEAMAAGKIIIASETGGIPFMIEDNENGKLFKPGNALELSQILKHIFQNKELYSKLGKVAKNRAQQYHIDNVADSYTEIIKQLLKNE